MHRLVQVRNGLLLAVFLLAPALVGASYQWAWPFFIFLILGAGLLTILLTITSAEADPRPALRLDATTIILGLMVLFLLLQQLPLPLLLVEVLSPQRAAIAQDAAGTFSELGHAGGGWVTLSLTPGSTWHVTWLLVGCWALLAMGRRIGHEPDAAQRWFAALGLIGLAIAAYGWMRWAADGGRLAACLGQANRAAGYLLLVLPLLVAVHETRERMAGRWQRTPVFAVGAVVVMLALLMTVSRWGIISAALAGLVGVFVVSRRQTATKVWSATALLAAMLLLEPLVARFVQLKPDQDRFTAWWHALDLWQEYWLLGAGVGSFGQAFQRYQPPAIDGWWAEAHNDYVNVLTDGGIVGLLLVLALLVSIAWPFAGAWRLPTRRRRFLAAAAAAACAGLALHAAGDFVLQIPALVFYFAFIAGLGMGILYRQNPPRARALPRFLTPQRTVGLAAAGLVLAAIPLIRFQAAGLVALAADEEHWAPTLPHTAGGWSERAERLGRAADWDPQHPDYALKAAHAYLAAAAAGGDPQQRRQHVAAARRRALQGLRACPADGRAYYYLAHLAPRRLQPTLFARALSYAPGNRPLVELITRRLLKSGAGSAARRVGVRAAALWLQRAPEDVREILRLARKAGVDVGAQVGLARQVEDGVETLGGLMLEDGQYAEADQLLGALLTERPDQPALWRQVFRARLRLAYFSGAEAAAVGYVKHADAGDRAAAAVSVWREYDARGLHRPGLDALTEMAAALDARQRPDLLRALQLAVGRGADRQRVAALARDLAVEASGPTQWRELERLFLRLKDQNNAMEVVERWAAATGQFEALLRLAMHHLRRREPALAVAAFGSAQRQKDLPPWARLQYARACVEIGRVNEAEKQLQHLLQAQPQRHEPYLLMSRVHLARGNLRQGRRVLEQGIARTGAEVLRRALDDLPPR